MAQGARETAPEAAHLSRLDGNPLNTAPRRLALP